ncbi:MAG: hypothetical protein PHW73_00520 [Atribacterota bacterium]|nr:hypothetical protein [Atribacterota bacterium]
METATKSILIISNGKFYRDGIEEKPEIGNLEQIKVLREYERKMDSLQGGMEVHVDYEVEITASASFTCKCSKKLHLSCAAGAEEDVDCFAERKITCPQCKTSYKFFINDDGNLLAKMI